jgi:hypothetical protein
MGAWRGIAQIPVSRGWHFEAAVISTSEHILPREADALTATKHFTFDLTGALARQLEAALPGLTQARLSLDALERIQQVPGIYQLYLRGELIYIGKADKSLRGRLAEHHKKISGRLRISIEDMSFTGLYLEGTWIPVGPEQMLINMRKKMTGTEPLWNTNGFGMNDPGKERDTTNFKSSHFDAMYPADLGYVIKPLERGTYPVSQLLSALKQVLPYVFRYENQWARHPDYLNSQVIIPQNPITAAQVFNSLVDALPPGWQITALPGYVIMYKSIRPYPSAQQIFKR